MPLWRTGGTKKEKSKQKVEFATALKIQCTNNPYQTPSAQYHAKPSTLSLGCHMAYFILCQYPRSPFWALWRSNQESVSANIYCMLKKLVAGVTSLDCILQVKSKLTRNAIYICRGVEVDLQWRILNRLAIFAVSACIPLELRRRWPDWCYTCRTTKSKERYYSNDNYQSDSTYYYQEYSLRCHEQE